MSRPWAYFPILVLLFSALPSSTLTMDAYEVPPEEFKHTVPELQDAINKSLVQVYRELPDSQPVMIN